MMLVAGQCFACVCVSFRPSSTERYQMVATIYMTECDFPVITFHPFSFLKFVDV